MERYYIHIGMTILGDRIYNFLPFDDLHVYWRDLEMASPPNIIVLNLKQIIIMNENWKIQHIWFNAFIFVYFYTLGDSYTCMVRPHQINKLVFGFPYLFFPISKY